MNLFIVVVIALARVSTTSTEPIACYFAPGDGRGGTEVKIGNQKGKECIEACSARKLTDSAINGVSVYSDTRKGGCWCERNMNRRNGNKRYMSCVLQEPIECNFEPGDGRGGTEVMIGNQMGKACIEACSARKLTDSAINGASVYSDTTKGGCWCERNMNRRNDNTRYMSCIMQVVGPTTAPVTPLPPHVGGCGQPDIKGITRVIGGKTAVRGSWPWQILLQYNGQGMCGGTLISPQWVVTAAHCVYGREDYPDDHSIVVGEQDRQTREGSEKEYFVEKIIPHKRYDPRRLDNDIAMIKLSKPVTFNKYVSPACLPTAEIPVNSKCFITGFGKITHPGRMTRFLQQAILPVVSNEVCYKKNKDFIRIPITDAMLCGGSGGSDIKSGCHGDSGGPYVCQVNGRWELHGSVSYGSSRCKSDETYTVFARTYHFLDWIKNNMKNE